jgi:tRNA G10  N-methylase Trm11
MSSKSVAVLGRQTALGLAELESLYGDSVVTKLGSQCALVDLRNEQISFGRLGSCIKLAKLLTILDTTDWLKIAEYITSQLPEHVVRLDEGKLTIGLSAIGFDVSPPKVNACGLSLKKIVKQSGRPCRIIPNKTAELSSATVLNNRLFSSHNWEILVIRAGRSTYLAQTTNVQDIFAYAARDQQRPKRDPRVGMLPPKLAQTIINMANPTAESVVLDPFCGTGVLLQEALLMGMDAYGSDLEERMIDYSKANLDWLGEKYDLGARKYFLAAGDATTTQWKPFDTIACETYLGRPLVSLPDPATLNKIMTDVDTIHKKFLANVARQTSPGFHMCVAVPAWKTNAGFKHLRTLDHLAELGYTRAVFKNASAEELIYHRPGQIVGRELAVLVRK